MDRVTLLGVQTPVVIQTPGPPVTEADVTAFEALLGWPLPPDYRAFLLLSNGGYPAVSDGATPDGEEFALDGFLELHAEELTRPSTQHLTTPAQFEANFHWGLPADALIFARDPGGNLFTLSLADPEHTVRFIDHESSAPFSEHEVLAQGFTSFLHLFPTPEAQAALDAQAQQAERLSLESGPFPAALDAQLRVAEAHHPGVRDAVRRTSLAVFDDKTHFSLHGDARSRQVFDLMLWLRDPAGGPVTRGQMHAAVRDWFRDVPGGFGLTGYAPGFLDDWWVARFDEGLLEGDVSGAGRLSRGTRDALMTVLQDFSG